MERNGQSESFNVIVVGGGPGGSTVATLLRNEGHSVLLLEKEEFPRYQIGESLLPSTVHGICRILGVTEQMERAGFTKKRGGTFRWGSRPEPWQFHFSVSPRMSGPTSYAYQVERATFDNILLRNAEDRGAVVREQCAVTGILTSGDRVTGVTYVDATGQPRSASARFLVDASGNTSRLQRHVGGSRRYSEFFRNIAVFGYFVGGRRLPAPDSGNIFSVAFDRGWIWYIPLRDDLTSVGVVMSAEHASAVQADPERAWLDMIGRCPTIAEWLDGVPQVREGWYGAVRVRKDYSYTKDSFYRPGMLLVGDAACFIDPVFSSGVHLATYSGLLAVRSINSVLAGELDEQRSFAEYEARYRREYALFYEFLVAFYDMHRDEDSYFWQAKKILNHEATTLEAFVELVGGVAAGDSGTTPAGRFAETARGLASAVEEAADNTDDLRNPLFGSAIVGAALEESAQLQALAALGGDAVPAPALVPNGLVPSADGLRWVEPSH